MNTPEFAIEPQDWDNIIEKIQEGKCILCLGPDAYSIDKEQSLEEELSLFLKARAERLKIRVYDDGWFHYLPQANFIDAFMKVKEFYKQPQPHTEALLKKIAQIPFHFIVNFTPDYKVREAFKAQNLDYTFQSYLKKAAFDPSIKKPTTHQPMIYNMLGELDKKDSLVMTYNDFYEYLESVFAAKSMSEVLKEDLFSADYFIFLGLPFEKWYVHLFMRILKQHAEKRGSKKYAANVKIDNEIIAHCDEQYTIDFISKGISHFINELYLNCEKKGVLRQPKAEPPPPGPSATMSILIDFSLVEKWFVNNKVKLIFEHLDRIINLMPLESPVRSRHLQIKRQSNEIEDKSIKGILEPHEKNRFNDILLKHIEQLKSDNLNQTAQ